MTVIFESDQTKLTQEGGCFRFFLKDYPVYLEVVSNSHSVNIYLNDELIAIQRLPKDFYSFSYMPEQIKPTILMNSFSIIYKNCLELHFNKNIVDQVKEFAKDYPVIVTKDNLYPYFMGTFNIKYASQFFEGIVRDEIVYFSEIFRKQSPLEEFLNKLSGCKIQEYKKGKNIIRTYNSTLCKLDIQYISDKDQFIMVYVANDCYYSKEINKDDVNYSSAYRNLIKIMDELALSECLIQYPQESFVKELVELGILENKDDKLTKFDLEVYPMASI
jgi:hypothetical protein